MNRFQFPAWVNPLLPAVAGFAAIGLVYFVGLFAYATHPLTSDVGYRPGQPVPFSHALHAGKLKMDCRYCHNTVEVAGHAAVPPLATCLNCHSAADEAGQTAAVSIHTSSPKLAPVRESAATGKPLEWRRVHDLPDYAYFNHSAHVARGVSCVACHGRVDRMEVVEQRATLSMGFCLTCHRNPAPNLRPEEFVTKLDWVPENNADPAVLGAAIMLERGIHPSDNCSTCHR